MASIDSLSFGLINCSLLEQSESHRCWMSSTRVAHTLRYRPGPPPWLFDLENPDAATEFYRRQCQNDGGVMLSMDVIAAAGVEEALRGLFKYRAPVPGSLAMHYVGVLWLPFQECNFQLNVEAIEAGITGTREAAVMLIERDKWPKPSPDTPPIVVKSAGEMFERMASAPVRQLPSDDEKYDKSFPNHPLSLVRKRLAEVVATAMLDKSARSLKRYRI